MILKLHGNETRSSCDQRSFSSLGASRLVDAASPQTISINKKKYPLEPRVQDYSVLFNIMTDCIACWGKKARIFFSFSSEHTRMVHVRLLMSLIKRNTNQQWLSDNFTVNWVIKRVFSHDVTAAILVSQTMKRRPC